MSVRMVWGNLRLSYNQLTAVTAKESIQATESSVAVGPAVVNVSKSNLTAQTSKISKKNKPGNPFQNYDLA